MGWQLPRIKFFFEGSTVIYFGLMSPLCWGTKYQAIYDAFDYLILKKK